MSKQITIFFSWQTDVAKCRDVIRKALTIVKNDNKFLNISVDEAMRNVPGSPDISAILEGKIKECDLFVADLTTVYDDGKECHPNTNVVYEYGLARERLGDEKIVLLAEENMGSLERLPFDFNHKRISKFSLKKKTENCMASDDSSFQGEAKRIAGYINKTLQLLWEKGNLFLNENTLADYPKFQVDLLSNSGGYSDLYFAVTNACKKHVSELKIDKAETKNELNEIISGLDATKARFESKTIAPGQTVNLSVNNPQIIIGVGKHPKYFHLFFSCKDETYKEYKYVLCGEVKKYDNLQSTVWSIIPEVLT